MEVILEEAHPPSRATSEEHGDDASLKSENESINKHSETSANKSAFLLLKSYSKATQALKGC